MFVMTMKFDRKKAAIAVIIAAVVIIALILLIGTLTRGGGESESVSSVKNEKGRVAYLNQCGWQVESPAASSARVIIPRTFSNVFENYNQLQIEQGFDLSQYCGSEVEVYTYNVLNGPEDETVVAQMYVLNGAVIGGDIHSTALNGFMSGLKK